MLNFAGNHLKKGINIDSGSGTLQGPLAEYKYVKIIKDAGFDHVRIPIPGKTLEEGGKPLWDKVRTVCELYLKHGLTPIFDMHGYYQINREPQQFIEGFLNLWESLAAYLADMDERVVFEILNEPNGAVDHVLLNQIQNEAIKRIRKSNPTRLLAAATTHCNTIERLHHLKLPENDPNIFITIHDYTPMAFTHQGANWMSSDEYKRKGIIWGKSEEMDYLRARYDLVSAWVKLNKRYIHLGEFGVYNNAEMSERVKWTAFVARLCEEHDFGWCYWEFWHGFGAYDRKKDDWVPELLGALMPQNQSVRSKAV